MKSGLATVSPEPTWLRLRDFTPARVALGRSGGSLPTPAMLNFRLAHARARDALQHELNPTALRAQLAAVWQGDIAQLESEATSFSEFLFRPDRGRLLSARSAAYLQSFAQKTGSDLAIVLSEGLSALALEKHAAAVLAELLPALLANQWRLTPLCLVRRGRVAVQDHVGEILGAQNALILLGERPGLLSPDSLGAYLVHGPRRGKTDADRNCLSNIHEHGLSPKEAARKLAWLLNQMRTRGLSGVNLKEDCLPIREPNQIGQSS